MNFLLFLLFVLDSERWYSNCKYNWPTSDSVIVWEHNSSCFLIADYKYEVEIIPQKRLFEGANFGMFLELFIENNFDEIETLSLNIVSRKMVYHKYTGSHRHDSPVAVYTRLCILCSM